VGAHGGVVGLLDAEVIEDDAHAVDDAGAGVGEGAIEVEQDYVG